MEVQHSTKVVLLHKNHPHHHRVVELMSRTASQTVTVDLKRAGEGLYAALSDCDLIVVEAFGSATAQWQALGAVRAANCLAPVVMLTNREQEERTVHGIQAGADAVISLSKANDVIVAHCRALMRRWRSQPHATPRLA